MCIGVIIGFAVMKFSGSIMLNGFFMHIIMKIDNIILGIVASFHENVGWNGDFSLFLFIPVWFDDPWWCSVIRWMIIIAVMPNGRAKWIDINRFNVGFPTANPPHNHFTNSGPSIGIADARFVITVAPHNDICPHGKTYPMNAVAISNSSRAVPVDHVSIFLYDELCIPRAM